jgi:PAS domain S-box-containing protein
VRGRDGEPIGILVLQVRIEKFFDWTRGIDIGPGGSVHVVDREGHLAHHPKSPAQGAIVNLSSNAIVARVRRGESGVAVGTDPVDGSEQLMAFAPTARGWGVIAQQPAAIAFAARNDQIVRLLTGYAVIAAFGAALVYLAVRLGAERRRAEEDLRAKAELEREVHSRTRELEAAARELADLYDNAPCGYHSVDAEGKFVRMNATWLAWLGYSRDEVVGKLRHPDIMTPASAEQFRTKWFPLFRRQGWLREVEFEYVRRDGSTFPASLDASSIHDEAGNYVMSRSTVYDITERKRIERERQALNARLEAANKELESFSYSVSHDLRAPLRAIDGYALMLQEDYAARLDNEGRRLLAVVRDEAGRMGQLIDDLLHFSRTGRQRLDAVPVDMRALVAEVITELRVAHPRAAIELAELPRAVGDRAMLRQVWVNLVGNALKYSAKAPEPRVEIGGRAAGADLEYWVRDNGVGFDPRYTERLFGVFQRLHREEEFPGTGVGLAIVQRVVARHGGRVAAEGRPGEGARFSFSLPASGSPA